MTMVTGESGNVVAHAYYESRKRLGFPMAPRKWVEQLMENAA